MNAITVTSDEATARTALREASARLTWARERSDEAMTRLRNKLVDIRPQGLLTVTEMAEAIGRDRNYVDSVWSAYGAPVKGTQTRVPVTEAADAEAARAAYDDLAHAASEQKRTLDNFTTVRAERNRLVVLIYQSRILGPSDIAREADIDRNHVLRIARNANVRPVHRKGSRNQYTSK